MGHWWQPKALSHEQAKSWPESDAARSMRRRQARRNRRCEKPSGFSKPPERMAMADASPPDSGKTPFSAFFCAFLRENHSLCLRISVTSCHAKATFFVASGIHSWFIWLYRQRRFGIILSIQLPYIASQPRKFLPT